MRRLIAAVLLCALALPFLPSCGPLTPGSATQPVSNADQIAAAVKVYDFWRDRAAVLGAVAMGPNPTQARVDDYNRSLFYMDSIRQTLVLLGAPSPADTPPYVQLVGGHVVPVK